MLTKKGLFILTAIFICIASLEIFDSLKLKRIGNNGVVTEAMVQYKRTSGRNLRSHHITYVFLPIGLIGRFVTLKGECEVQEKKYNRTNIGDKIEITYNRLNFNESYCGDLRGISTGRIIALHSGRYLVLVVFFVLISFVILYLRFSKSIRKILYGENYKPLNYDVLSNFLDYNSFKPNKFSNDNSIIYIEQPTGLYTFIIFSIIHMIGICALAYVVYIKSSSIIYYSNFIAVCVVGLWITYPYIVMFRNGFSTYNTIIFLNRNSISFTNIFREVSIVAIDDFNNVTFSSKLYFDGFKSFDYKVLLHYQDKKYVILSGIPYKERAQYAISTLEDAVKSKNQASQLSISE